MSILFKVILNNSLAFPVFPASSSLKKCNHGPIDRKLFTRKAFLLTFLKNAAGAISAPLRVLKRNIGQEDAFIWNPEDKQKAKQTALLSVFKIQQEKKSVSPMPHFLYVRPGQNRSSKEEMNMVTVTAESCAIHFHSEWVACTHHNIRHYRLISRIQWYASPSTGDH